MITTYLQEARQGAKALQTLTPEQIDEALAAIAMRLESEQQTILRANEQDVSVFPEDDPRYDRLLLTSKRIQDIAKGMRDVALLPSPLNRTIAEWVAPNGLQITKVSQPFGVIGVVYEARPNVSCDVFALCFKAGSAVVLKGGKEAHHTNTALVQLMKEELKHLSLDPRLVTLLPADRTLTEAMLQAVGQIDLVIPRGSKGLIDYVRATSRVPVIETGAGICHTYFASSGDLAKGARIVENAKCRRVSVCNALDTLLIDVSRLGDLPQLCAPLVAHQVALYADERALIALKGNYPEALLFEASAEHFGTEYLDYKMSIGTMDSLDEALDHIDRYSSKHSEAIIAEEEQEQNVFRHRVDAACVYVNASTAFTDGGEFGFGAEIGISTQKLHARGPMGLPEIMTYKYQIRGDGNVRV